MQLNTKFQKGGEKLFTLKVHFEQWKKEQQNIMILWVDGYKSICIVSDHHKN